MYSIALDLKASDKRTERFASVFGTVFSLCTAYGNRALFYAILSPSDYPLVRKAYFAICLILVLAAGFTAGRAVFFLLLRKKPANPEKEDSEKTAADIPAGKNASRLFFGSFVLFWGIDLLYLFLCGYPGNITTDSLSQLNQILTGVYHNQHPYWHTQFIRLFFMPVYRASGDVNAGAAAYCAAQSCILSLVFAYMTDAIRNFSLGRRSVKMITAASVLYFAFSPVHILYSITIWKDVLFGAMTALLITAAAVRLHRLHKTGTGNLCLVVIGTAGMCLFRSNGWMAAAATFICMLPVFALSGKDPADARKTFRPVMISMAAVLAVTFVMNHAVIDRLGIEKGGILEACGIPLQQTARILYEGKTISAEDAALIEQAAPAAEIISVFDPEIVDPVKGVLRIRRGEEQINRNRKEYLYLWLRLSARHPDSALRAWADLTRGYWDAGLDRYLWAQGTGQNDLGFYSTERFAPARMIKNSYLWLFEHDAFLKLIKCMGLQAQFLLALFLKQLAERKKSAVLCLPVLFIWLTVLLAVPVNGEYRYLYSLATTLPVLAASAFSEIKEQKY